MIYLLPQLVDRSAERDPGHDAVRCRKESLTWSELARRANALAHMLVNQGVKPGDRVGILMHKRVECAVAIHGIMKAGAAYVPLDPLAPASRHAYIVKDCGIRVLLAEPRTAAAAAALVEDAALDIVYGLDDGSAVGWGDVASSACDAPPQVRVMENDLCYVLYTSGSTGVPKGIMHSHRSALAWAEVSAAEHRIAAYDRISNYAPLHFDLSTLDYFAGALAGATTVMIPEEYARFPASLAGLLEQERLTLLYTVPFALVQLATTGVLEGLDLSALRAVLFGGEPLPVKHLRTLMALLPETEFCNVYGPTEVNGCTRWFLPSPLPDEIGALPIGETYANVEALVVGPDDAPCAVGERGELLIRAPTMMRGYWNRDDLNQRVFYRRPLHSGLPDLFLRTGDIVVQREDGAFDFIGRGDRLIKTRGCRVDLDEIEAALCACDGVAEGAVFPVRGADDTLSVHAAARVADGDVTVAALQAALRQVLPVYALPAQLTLVDAFPRTSTNKIDRRALRRQAENVASDDAAQLATL